MVDRDLRTSRTAFGPDLNGTGGSRRGGRKARPETLEPGRRELARARRKARPEPLNRAGEELAGRGGRRNGRHRTERNETPLKRHLNASSGEHDFPVLNPIEGLRRAVRRSDFGNRTPDRRTQRNDSGKPQETSDDDELETNGSGGRRRG